MLTGTFLKLAACRHRGKKRMKLWASMIKTSMLVEKLRRVEGLKAALAKQAAAHPEMWKVAINLPIQDVMPLSPLTARSQHIAAGGYKKPQVDRRGELQATLEQLVANMPADAQNRVQSRRRSRTEPHREVAQGRASKARS
jgi:hypothetical protein